MLSQPAPETREPQEMPGPARDARPLSSSSTRWSSSLVKLPNGAFNSHIAFVCVVLQNSKKLSGI